MSKQMFLVLNTEHNRKQCQSHKIGTLIASTNAGALDVKQVTVERQDKMLRPSKSYGGSINPCVNGHRWFEESAVNDFRPRLAGDIVKLRHNGWYVDDEFQDETTFGIVLRLPNKRGFLAGCSDPYNWPKSGFGACYVENYVYDDEDTAARCADRIAEVYAEECCNDARQQREQQALEDAENERQEIIDNLP